MKINRKYNKLIPAKATFIDVYRVLQMFEVTDPCLQHAIKKLLQPGKRGVKDLDLDINEAMQSLQRYFDMREEEVAMPVPPLHTGE